MEKTVSEAIAHRRSTRIYLDQSIDSEKVKSCLRNATLAPTSSNLQLWEFYHITDPNVLQKLAKACLNQNAAKTAQELVVVVTRKDLWRKRAKANLAFWSQIYRDREPSPRDQKRKKTLELYYGRIIPNVYADVFGLLGMMRYLVVQIIGMFRPIYRQVRLSDLRIVAHKSAGLAAENFMISMAAIGYDTCPMEGSDTLLIKKILGLPRRAEINMVIGCGIRSEKGIYGPRFRVPFEEVYFRI